MSGVECIRSYREWVLEQPHASEHRINREMLILGLSANACELERREAFKYGMHYFCPKPAEMSLLTTILSIHKHTNGSLSESLKLVRQVVENFTDTPKAEFEGFDAEPVARTTTPPSEQIPHPKSETSRHNTIAKKLASLSFLPKEGTRRGWMIFGKSSVAPIDSMVNTPRNESLNAFIAVCEGLLNISEGAD